MWDAECVLYDPLHCIALTLTHGIIHALRFWVLTFAAVQLPNLDTVLDAHTRRHPFFPAAHEAIQLADWSLSNNLAKELLHSDSFWQELAAALPTTAQGLVVTCNGIALVNPLQLYLKHWRYLAEMLLSKHPQGVARRDELCTELHKLYVALKLSPRRFTVAYHYFVHHYTHPLQHFGNLWKISSEGGEHMHQPHTRIASTRPSNPRSKCPEALKVCVQWGALQLALWREGAVSPS